MMSFFEKLMLARQISFKNGDNELMSQRMIFFPTEFISLYTLELEKDYESTKTFYSTVKQNMKNGFAKNVAKSHGYASKKDYSQLLKEIGNLTGWGKFSFEQFDEINNRGIVVVEDSPVGSYLKGKVESPCDHIIRGLIAGGATVVFGKEVEVVETECIALGSKVCRFIVGDIENLNRNYPSLYKIQIV